MYPTEGSLYPLGHRGSDTMSNTESYGALYTTKGVVFQSADFLRHQKEWPQRDSMVSYGALPTRDTS